MNSPKDWIQRCIRTYRLPFTFHLLPLPVAVIDCSVLYEQGTRDSGVYEVNWGNSVMVNITCDMRGNGWTVRIRGRPPV